MAAMKTAMHAATMNATMDPIMVQALSAEGAWALVAEVQREVETMMDHRDLVQEDLDAQRAHLGHLVAVAMHVEGVALSEPMLLDEDDPDWLGSEEEVLGVGDPGEEPEGDRRPALDDDGDGNGNGDGEEGDWEEQPDDLAYALQSQTMGIVGLAWDQTERMIEIATGLGDIGQSIEIAHHVPEIRSEASRLLSESAALLAANALDMRRAIGALDELHERYHDAIGDEPLRDERCNATTSREDKDDEEEQRHDEEFLSSRNREWFVGVTHCADGSVSLHEAAESLRGFAEELDDAMAQGYELRQPVYNGGIVCLKTTDPMYHPVRRDAMGNAYIDHTNDTSNASSNDEETDR